MSKIVVVYNGPSSIAYRKKLQGKIYGCNFAYRDFDLDAVFAVDALAVKQIDQDQPNCRYFTKKRSWTPKGWNTRIIPGIDSGSYALETAILENSNSNIFVIGADGVLKQNNSTVYDYYWRNGQQPTAYSHTRHRNTVIELIKLHKPRILFVTDFLDDTFETITTQQFEKIK